MSILATTFKIVYNNAKATTKFSSGFCVFWVNANLIRLLRADNLIAFQH